MSVISNDSVFGGESYILIVVECDLIGVGSDRYCLAVSGNRGVAVDRYRGFGNCFVKRLAINCFVFCDLISRIFPIVVYGVAEVVLDFILCGVGNIFCDGFSNRRIPTCEFIAIVGGNGRCCRSVAAQLYTGCYIAFVILIGKIAVIALVIGNGAFRSRALYAGDVEVIDFISCGEGGFRVESMINVLVKFRIGRVKLYDIRNLIGISCFSTVCSFFSICRNEFPAVCSVGIFYKCGGSTTDKRYTSRQTIFYSVCADTFGDGIGYRLKCSQQVFSFVCIISIGLAVSCWSCDAVFQEITDSGAVLCVPAI